MTDPSLWIDQFLTRYRKLFAPHDWPTDDDDWLEFVALWVATLRRNGVTHGEANAAAVQLAGYPPRFRNDHLPAVIETVKSTRPSLNPADRTRADIVARQREAAIRERKALSLTQRWESLTDAEREEIRAEVIAENPGLAKWESFIRPLCLARLQQVAS